MACQAEALAKVGGKCWTTIRDSEQRHLGQLTGGGTGSSNAPVVASGLFEDTGFTGRQPDHFPENLACHPKLCARLHARPPSLKLWRTSFILTRLCVGSERRMVAGVGVAPTEAERMRLA